MGKALALASITFIVLGTYYGSQRRASELATRKSVSGSQYETIARNGALAGMNMARQELAECFLSGTSKGSSGGADYQVQTNVSGDLARITSVGSIMGANDKDVDYTVVTVLQRWNKEVPFDIVDKETIPKVSFNVETKVIGSEISYGGAYDMPVTLRIDVGGKSYEPFGDYDSGHSAVSSDQMFTPDESFAADTPVSVSARSWIKDGRGWKVFMEQDSRAGDDQLVVLRNGDVVPSVKGLSGQTSVGTLLAPFTEHGKIKLNESQSIYLFELGSSNPSSAAYDLQDLVVLIDLSPAGNQTETTTFEDVTDRVYEGKGKVEDKSACGGYELRLRHYNES